MLNQIAGFDATALRHRRKKTYGVKVGHIQVGSGAPVVVQSMTNTDTADVETTLQQTLELAEAGSELVRWTVNVPEAAAAVPVIKKRLLDAGCRVPIIGDFHYNGHVLLTKYPDCAKSLDKYRLFFDKQDPSKFIDKVMEISHVKSITMTTAAPSSSAAAAAASPTGPAPAISTVEPVVTPAEMQPW